MGNNITLTTHPAISFRLRLQSSESDNSISSAAINFLLNAQKMSHIRRQRRKSRHTCSKMEFYRRVKSSPAGSKLLACTFDNWCKRQRADCGFSDRADYTSNRQPLLRLNGSSTRSDTTEGRYFQCHFKSKQELGIHEKESLRSFSVHLPRAMSPELVEYLRNNRRPGRRHRGIKTCRVVAFHDRTLVVQVNSDQHRPFAKMYLIDLELKTCQGHFVITHGLRRWYEVYISPGSDCLLLRPDVRYQFQAVPAFTVQNITWYPPRKDTSVCGIPSTLYQHRFTFNTKLGDDHVIGAAHRHVRVFKIEDFAVVENYTIIAQYAVIQQIRSSPSGDYLAVRYTYPEDGCSINHILILHYPQFSKAMQVDVRSAYWPLSDMVNLQLFPRFSLSESCLAVIKQYSYTRRVFVYKLPSIQLHPLRQLCRQAILHLVHTRDVGKLPLPRTLQRFLLQPVL